MAPTRSKKQNSSESSGYEAGAENVPTQTTAVSQEHRATTPDRSPSKQPVAITQAQKQALIDNLQLEITERARKLRAQYALQSQGLRSRLEMRINRIPQALRKANLAELLAKHVEQANAPKPNAPEASAKNAPTQSTHASLPKPKTQTAKDTAPSRGTKRTSNQMSSDDKENEVAGLPMPKKRAKASGPSAPSAPPARATRTASRKVNPSQVLSPKSNNSRTLPQSPMRPPPLSLPKSQLARPISPYKSAASVEAATASLAELVSEKPKAPRAASRQAKTGAAAPKTTGAGRGRKAAPKAPQAAAGHVRSSDGSNASDASAGTTIVHKQKVEKKPPAKKGIATRVAATTAAAKKAATARAKTETTTAAPAGGRRVLRKR